MSDGGLDLPNYVAAVCPNCHRRAHYGGDKASFNISLGARVQALEALWE